jgi:hypothetical protein
LKRFAEWQAKGKHCVLLACGDHDIHGLRISRALRDNLAEVLSAFKAAYPQYADFDLDAVEIVRFGLNADFIKRHRLSWTQGLITGSGLDLGDPSHPHHNDHDVKNYIAEFGERKLEADALVTRAQAGRDLCRRAILKYVDTDGIAEFEAARQVKRDELRQEIDRMLSTKGVNVRGIED